MSGTGGRGLFLRRPPGGLARSAEEAQAVATRIGYPVLVRPSYVLGGRAMEIVHDKDSLRDYMHYAVKAFTEGVPQGPAYHGKAVTEWIDELERLLEVR